MITRLDALMRLRAAPWVRDPNAQKILAVLDGGSGSTRVVGGLVRDTVLGLPRTGTDLDLATVLLPNEVTARAHEAGMAWYPTGIDHGTVTLRLGAVMAEVTTLREDMVTDGRRAQVRFGTDWRKDARRRDFTMNALYASPAGELHDPIDGLGDCIARRVRFIGQPDQSINEDRLRVYRFFRFSASHGGEAFDPEGLDACGRWAEHLKPVSAERIGAEMIKMLELGRVAKTLAVMTKLGILDFAPETLAALLDYEILTETPTALARLALILTRQDTAELQARWRLSNALIADAERTLFAAALMVKERFHEVAYRYARLGMVALPVAATLGQWPPERLVAARETLRGIAVPTFPVSGDDLRDTGFAEGPELGKMLALLEKLWIDSGFAHDRAALLAQALRLSGR